MPNLNAGRFSRAETLKRIRRESLLTWLAPAREYLVGRGIVIPELVAGTDGNTSPRPSPQSLIFTHKFGCWIPCDGVFRNKPSRRR